MSMGWLWGVALGVALAIGTHRTAGASGRVVFPQQRYGKAELVRAARAVEQATQMPGFADFAVSVAENESKFNSLAVDDSMGARVQAERGLRENPGRYGSTPWPRSWYQWGTGGWYQLLPTTALASAEWNSENPMLVFPPYASTVLLASFVQRVVRNHFSKLPQSARNWLTIRRFMRSNTMGYDYEEQLPHTAAKRERYGRDLEKHGIPASFMYKPVPRSTVRATPELYRRILAAEGLSAEEV